MDSHEEFRELCAAEVAGELDADERARLTEHLAICHACRSLKTDYEATTATAAGAFAEAWQDADRVIDPWSVKQAEERFSRRLAQESRSTAAESNAMRKVNQGAGDAYCPPRINWREISMLAAAAILLALALGVAAYRSGIKHGTDIMQRTGRAPKGTGNTLDVQLSSAGYERAQFGAKLADNAKTINELKRQLDEQVKIVNSSKSNAARKAISGQSHRESDRSMSAEKTNRDAELLTAPARLVELLKAVDTVTAQRDENARQASALEAKVNELAQLARTREQALEQKEAEVAKGQQLLDHDHDIRELMGSRDLYMADIHDVSGRGTEKTYGRVFYTKGKSLIVYAFDLDAQPGLQNAKSFQAWGRKGSDKLQARSLGIFYQDNATKKRWVLKADDPKALEDIDAVFVTIEPRGGSEHPSGKQLLFASLRTSPNHP
jgi:hypothetical protein